MDNFPELIDFECSRSKELISSGQCCEVNNCFDIHLLNPLYALVSQVSSETQVDVLSRSISAISDLSHFRFEYHATRGANMFYTTYMDLMSDYEKAELHRLKMLLPSSGQIIADAKIRVRERLLARKSRASIKGNSNETNIAGNLCLDF